MPLTVLVTNPTPDLYGASRMALESVAGFRERGWRVVVCVPERGPLNEAMAELGAEVLVCPSPVLRKTYLGPRGLVRLALVTFRAVPRAVRILRTRRPDVLYVNTITEPLWLLLGWVLRIPVVAHVHEAESGAPGWMRRALAAPLLLARRLIVNSRFSERVACEAWPRLAHRSVVVANGVAGPPQRQPPRDDLRPPVRLLYLGRISERKGVADAVEAIALLRDRGLEAHLDVVGAVFPGYEPVEEALRALVDSRDIGDRVRFRGFHPEVWSHLAEADVLVVPSRWDEPFGNTAVEGLLAARPVIATAAGGLAEAVAGIPAAVTVDPSSPTQIADAVEQIVHDWPAWRRQALLDSDAAERRHAPARYRRDVADVVGAVAG